MNHFWYAWRLLFRDSPAGINLLFIPSGVFMTVVIINTLPIYQGKEKTENDCCIMVLWQSRSIWAPWIQKYTALLLNAVSSTKSSTAPRVKRSCYYQFHILVLCCRVHCNYQHLNELGQSPTEHDHNTIGDIFKNLHISVPPYKASVIYQFQSGLVMLVDSESLHSSVT